MSGTVMVPSAEFAGSDTVGSARISEITGIPEDEFQPLVPQWAPPSGEVESALFALQAAVGGIVLGYVFGTWQAQRRMEKRIQPVSTPDTDV
ncbi:MAG TPA: cobalt transport protein CbiN [Methanoregulaceae archaeon]|nr:cobalt transport protein CbiN [Methanoregulaceae archaeon]